MSQRELLPTADVVFRDDLYPRIKHDPALVQRYAQNLDVLPPIEVNQHMILIDGWHRWTAHRSAEAATIPVVITETSSEAELFALAIKRNAAHGWQMAETDKRSAAIRLYGSGTGLSKAEIAATLSVTERTVTGYLNDIDKRLREERKQRIFDLWLACYTQQEIAEAVGTSRESIDDEIQTFGNFGNASVSTKSLEFGRDNDWQPPIYNVWAWSKKTNAVEHFGNSEQRIVDNLLYLYTEPFDIVVDPFGGGGSTIDVCRKRLRRYWVSDRKPIVEREAEIRRHDLATDGVPPLNRRWSDVSLTYLDPPYWRQAAGEYSNDPTDLANMPLDEFTSTLANVVKEIGKRQSKGVIALLIQPTQWRADDRAYTDHVTDLVRAVGNGRLVLENRVSCPYSTEQCTPQMVEWAKEHRSLLVLTRELIVWRVRA